MSVQLGTSGPDAFATKTTGVLFDALFGVGGDDVFTLNVPTRTFFGYGAPSFVFGGADNDRMIFRPVADFSGKMTAFFTGGAGVDTAQLDYSALGAVGFSLAKLGGAYAVTYTLSHLNGSGAGTITVASDVERFIITGSAKADSLIGNAGDDYLDGKAGADTFYETAGDDWYVFDNDGDRVLAYRGVAAGGTDSIVSTVTVDLRQQAGIENLRLEGTAAIDATGTDGANLITGNAAANVITAGGGLDRLYGKGGADVFAFAEMGADNADAIWDFDADDRLALDADVFGGLDANRDGVLDASAFTVLTRAGATTTAAGPQVIYNAATGIVSYDADGNGAGLAQDITLIGRVGFFDSGDVLIA